MIAGERIKQLTSNTFIFKKNDVGSLLQVFAQHKNRPLDLRGVPFTLGHSENYNSTTRISSSEFSVPPLNHRSHDSLGLTITPKLTFKKIRILL